MSRVRVIGGPWPERIGCEGVIASPPTAAAAKHYPWSTTPKYEVIVLLDSDPVAPDRGDGWTCTLSKTDITGAPGAAVSGEAP